VYSHESQVYDGGSELHSQAVWCLAATTDNSGGDLSMATVSGSPSLVRVIAWACFGPFVALGGLALLVFGFGALAIAARLLLALFGHGGV
jgi:hypothetical protein